MNRKSLVRMFSAATAVLASSAGALAHPHVFVSVRSAIVFADDGKVTGVRHSWTFDDMYSAFATQGLGPSPEKLASDLQILAKVNVEQLEEASFFTFLKLAGKPLEFASATDYGVTLDKDKILTLSFTVPLKRPAATGRAMVLQVTDPSYFVAFDFERDQAVTLVNAPQGCSLSLSQPQALTASEQKRLNEVANSNDSPGQDFGFKLASRAIIACP